MSKHLQALTGKPPAFEQILTDLQILLNSDSENLDTDFYPILQQLSQQYEVSEELLLQKGFRKAYRLLVEGL